MGDSKIEWTKKTWNPVRGCTKVSPGCKHCYAETFAERWRGIKGHPYEQGFDLRLVPEKLSDPLRWKKPQRIFVNSMSDLFHESVPDWYIAAVFGVMAARPWHTFQILTKRAERLPKWFAWDGGLRSWDWAMEHPADCGEIRNADVVWPLPNVHLGVSVESPDYLHRLDDLMATPAAIRWVSLEPLLADVDIRPWLDRCNCNVEAMEGAGMHAGNCTVDQPRLDWVVCGGESGPGARPFDLAWARRIVGDCRAAGVPVFVKQLGRNVFDPSALMWHTPTEAGELGLWEIGHRTARQVASVWPNGTWHTWDAMGVGGENSQEPTVEDAKREAEAALMRQHMRPIRGWAKHRPTYSHPKGGDPGEWPEDLRVRQFPEARKP